MNHAKQILTAVLVSAALLHAPCTTANASQVQLTSGKDIVVFNVSNNKFHAPHCIWACRCTVHCINISRDEAHKRGGIPCKVCAGGE